MKTTISKIFRIAYWIIFVFTCITLLDGYTILPSMIVTAIVLYGFNLGTDIYIPFSRVRYPVAMLAFGLAHLYYYFTWWGTEITSSQQTILYLAPVIALITLILKLFLPTISNRFQRNYYMIIDLVLMVVLVLFGIPLIR
jgi:hypothetical protein